MICLARICQFCLETVGRSLSLCRRAASAWMQLVPGVLAGSAAFSVRARLTKSEAAESELRLVHPRGFDHLFKVLLALI